MKEESNLPTISSAELSFVENNMLNAQQLKYLLQKTPKNHIYKRPAKGGGEWQFVTGVYMKKVLNLMFGWDWSFEVIEHKFDLQIKQAYVLGKLTVNSGGKTIVKMQFGRVDIKFKKQPNESGVRMPLDIGNDLKAATTDALKKCASELGIASDVYAPNEFKAIEVMKDPTKLDAEEQRKQIDRFLDMPNLDLTQEERNNAERIMRENEEESYSKLLKILIKTKTKK